MASQHPSMTGQTFCWECGKPIEADARYCRFCGKSQAERPAEPVGAGRSASVSRANPPRRTASGNAGGFEQRLRQLFPRHHLQDEFMHVATITAFLMALIGFVLGFFIAFTWLAQNFLLGAIALILFLILRESTLSHIRTGSSPSSGSTGSTSRYEADRPGRGQDQQPPEAATTQSTPAAAPPAPRPRPSPPPRA